MKKHSLLMLIWIIPLLTCCSFNNKYQAVYFTAKDSSVVSIEELQENNILELNSFEELKSKVDKLDYKLGIFIDKSVLQDEMITKNLNKWLIKKKDYPIIVVGYGNPTYVFFKKLVFTDEQYIPKFDDETYNKFKKEKGYSFSYICEDGTIYGKGYKEKINFEKMVTLIKEALIGKQSVEKMMGEEV